MGSPLAPVLANLFMGHHEKMWLEQYKGDKPLFYQRYVDDIFAVFNNENDADQFLLYLNSKHSNIKFTIEKEKNRILPFLDILIDNSNKNLTTSIFRKKTFTGLLTNFQSFTCFSYKISLINTLFHRIFEINNTWHKFHEDIKHIKTILKKNLYPEKLTDKILKRFLDKKLSNFEKTDTADSMTFRYFKLPYIGRYSDITKKKVQALVTNLCKDGTNIRIVFTSFKITNMFSIKDPVPCKYKCNVVYKFSCASCNACYIGETTRHFYKRVEEHLNDSKSNIFKHINSNTNCKDLCTNDCFNILDSASTEYQLKIKEGLHIEWEKPVLNKQVKHISSTLA